MLKYGRLEYISWTLLYRYVLTEKCEFLEGFIRLGFHDQKVGRFSGIDVVFRLVSITIFVRFQHTDDRRYSYLLCRVLVISLRQVQFSDGGRFH